MRGGRRIAAAGLGLMLAAASACDSRLIPARGGTAPPKRPVEATLLTFYQGHGLPRVSTVLRSEADAKAFPSWFAQVRGFRVPNAAQIAEVVSGRDHAKEAVVAFSAPGDCTSARSAELTGDGRHLLSISLTGTTEHQTCYAPYANLAIFAVDKTKAPAGLQLGGARTGKPDPVSPAELTAFAMVPDPKAAPRAAEISQPDQLDRFLGTLPVSVRGQIRSEISGGRAANQRRFGFVLTGCRLTSAYLTLTPERVYPNPVGGETIRCLRAEYFAAVFTVDAELVPPKAKIG